MRACRQGIGTFQIDPVPSSDLERPPLFVWNVRANSGAIEPNSSYLAHLFLIRNPKHMSYFDRMRPRTSALAALVMLVAVAIGRLQAQPHYTIIYSGRIATGQYAGDYDIFGAGFTADGLRDNATDQPRAISSLGFRELEPFAVTSYDGMCAVVYTVEHTDTAHAGDRDIVMRMLGREGQDMWGDSANRVVVVAQSKYAEQNARAAFLSDGSLMVCYEIHYDTSAGADVDIVAARFSHDGHMMWEKATWVANSKRREILKGLISDGNGGAIALIESQAWHTGAMAGSDIMAQRIDSSGLTGWKDSKEPTAVAASAYLESNPVMAFDGDGGIYVAYQLEYNKGPRAGDVDILAQHLTRYGSRAWTDEQNPPIVSSNAKTREENPAIVRDSSGIVIAFEMSFVPTKAKGVAHVVGMQRLDSNGRPTWNLGKRSTLIAVAHAKVKRPRLLADPLAGIYLTIEAHDTVGAAVGLYAQRVALNGDQIWGDGERPVPVFTGAVRVADAVMAPDNTNGFVVVAARRDPADSTGTTAFVASRLNIEGRPVWEALENQHVVVALAHDNSPPILVRQ